MPRSIFRTVLPGFLLSFVVFAMLDSQHVVGQEWPEYIPNNEVGEHDIDRGPGFYIAWWKLLMCIPFFLFWVKAADWVNVDIFRTQEKTKLEFDTWNPALVFSFFGGFLLLLCVPIFWIGYPLYLVGCILPYFLYLGQRNKLVPENDRTWFPIHADVNKPAPPVVLQQDLGVAVEISPAGDTPQRKQANLIAARQNPFFVQIKELLNDFAFKRADRAQLDFTQQAVGVRYEIDGVWLNMAPRDRQSGDAILYGLKQIANLNPMDRQNRQSGDFQVQALGKKLSISMTTVGVQTGESVTFKIVEIKKRTTMTILQQGMLPEMLEKLRQHINNPGYVVISAMPSDGLSTSWLGTLDAADRVTRDFVGVVDINHDDKVIENVEYREIEVAKGQSALADLKNLAMKMPQAYVMPDAMSGEIIDYLCDQIESEDVFAISRIASKSATEAVIRMLMLKPNRSKFAKHLKAVLFHRLFRRLCDQCKQPFAPQPQLLQQLGIQPDPKLVFYQQYQPPPPETLIDDKGKPIEPPPPCVTCGGIGYFGRIAVFELLEVNDLIRQAMVNKPNLNTLNQVAQKNGHRGVQFQAISLLSAGITSVQEIQRVLQK